jgi:hypothetical protein
MDTYRFDPFGNFVTIISPDGLEYHKDMEELASSGIYGFDKDLSSRVIDMGLIKSLCELNSLDYDQFLVFVKSPMMIRAHGKAVFKIREIERNLVRCGGI